MRRLFKFFNIFSILNCKARAILPTFHYSHVIKASGIVWLLCISVAHANPSIIFKDFPNQAAVTDFDIDLSSSDIDVREVAGVHRVFFKLEGRYNVPEGNLLINIKPIKIQMEKIDFDKNGEFKKEIPVRSEKIDFEVVSINIKGEIQRKRYYLILKNWIDLVAPERRDMATAFSAGFGLSSTNYKDTRISDFKQIALTGKLNFGKEFLRKKMNLSLNLFFTAFGFSKSIDSDVRFLGANARLGYLVPFIHYPLSLSLMGGLYYTTMFVSTNNFGFRNMSGPQFYPYLRYHISTDKSLGLYAKFSPIGENFSLLGLENREVASGLSYNFGFKKTHSLSLSLDWAAIDLTIEGVIISTSSITVGLSYTF